MNAKRHEPTDSAFLRARRALLLDHCFFGSLIMHLNAVEDSSAKRGVWADGKSIGYNSEALEAVVEKDLSAGAGLLAKSVLQCALGHHVRRGERDVELWNKASDYVINPEVLSTGLRLPDGALIDQAHAGKSVEQVYAVLDEQRRKEEKQQKQSQKPQDGAGDDGEGESDEGSGDGAGQARGAAGGEPEAGEGKPQPATGEVRDLPAGKEDGACAGEAEKADSAREWNITLQQALQSATSRGDLPGSLKALIEKQLAQQVSWKEQLRRWMQSRACDESTWAVPNRRFMSYGITLPTVRSVKMGAMVIGNDTSGSTGAAQAAFLSEMQAIVEDTSPERVLYLQCDTHIVFEQELEAGDELQTAVHGMGGTDLRKLFERVEEHELQPSCMIVLTDLATPFPDEEPPYPVLWVSVDERGTAPFGEVIFIDPTQR